jgi:sugar-specific transcriptional regulator TrmB
MKRYPPEEIHALQTIGLSREELEVYEFILQQPASTLDDIVEMSGQPRNQVLRLVRTVERKGLASHTLNRPPRYNAIPPDIGFGSLITKHQTGLRAARALAKRLRVLEPHIKSSSDESRAEIITGHETLLRVVDDLYNSAEREVLCFDRPPYVRDPAKQLETKLPTLSRGVVYRTIVDAESLAFPGRLSLLDAEVEAGENIRIGAGVPIKALIVDQRAALVPLDLKDMGQSGLVLRKSLLFDALYALFNLLWQRSVPFGKAGSEADNQVDALIAVLSAGVKDKALAYQLGISDRTLERRIAEMMKRVNAHTRFQAGWNAALHSVDKNTR